MVLFDWTIKTVIVRSSFQSFKSSAYFVPFRLSWGHDRLSKAHFIFSAPDSRTQPYWASVRTCVQASERTVMNGLHLCEGKSEKIQLSKSYRNYKEKRQLLCVQFFYAHASLYVPACSNVKKKNLNVEKQVILKWVT